VQTILEASGVVVDDGQAASTLTRRLPLSFAAYDGEIVGVWLPPHPAARLVAHVLAGTTRPGSGEVRHRPGSRLVLAHAGAPLERAFQPSVDGVLLDATDGDVSLDAWVRVATGRARGATVIVLTHSATDAYRCDRAVLAMWSASELLAALDSLVATMQGATSDLLAGASSPRRAALLAVELQRGNRAARDLIHLTRRMAPSQDDRLRLLDLAGRAAAVMLDERVLEKLIGEGDAL
jgi:hypothetical protein